MIRFCDVCEGEGVIYTLINSANYHFCNDKPEFEEHPCEYCNNGLIEIETETETDGEEND